METPMDHNPDQLPPDPRVEDELTEEDLFRMKGLSHGPTSVGVSETAEQSIISLADSASNFDEHVGDEFDEVETVSQDDIDAQDRIFNGWLFTRKRTENPELPKDTVTVLKYPQNMAIPSCPEGEDEEEWKNAFLGATVFLIGTAHFSKESQDDVTQTIRNTQPDLVMVELCPSRISILSMDEKSLLKEASELNTEKIMNIIKQSGAVQGLLHVMLLSMSAHITRQLSMAPGGEFRAAHRAAMQTQLCRLVLGDRPIQITLQRALSSLTLWQRLKFFWHVCMSHFSSITPEEVERCKKQDLLEELLAEMAGDFPKLSEIFVEERDSYMKHALHSMLCRNTVDKRTSWKRTDGTAEWQPLRIVAVVGIGHTPGIVSKWEDNVDLSPLVTVPPPSAGVRVFRYTLKFAFYGALGFMAYKGCRRMGRRFLH